MKSTYWLHYLCRERMFCSPCYVEGKGWVRIDPLPTPDCNPIKHQGSYRAKQKASYRKHVAANHPNLKIRWTL